MPSTTPKCGLLATLLALLALAGCVEPADSPTQLNERERRLVDEVVTLMELKVERARDPELSALRRDALTDLYPPEEVEALLVELNQEPERTLLVLTAVRESLKVRRPRIFPPTTVERPSP